MKPIRVASSNLVYTGPPGVGDLHCRREAPGLITSIWRPSPEERQAIAEGANLLLYIHAEPIPPVGLSVTGEEGVGEDAPELADRLEEWRRQQGGEP